MSLITPLQGFPYTGKFETEEALEAYFQESRRQCLLCGRWYKCLGNHLRAHELTADEYRGIYGIPVNRGLDDEELRDRRIAIQSERVKDPAIREALIERLAKGREVLDGMARKAPTVVPAMRAKRVRNTKGVPREVVYVERYCCICGAKVSRDSASAKQFKCDACQGEDAHTRAVQRWASRKAKRQDRLDPEESMRKEPCTTS